MKDWWKKNWEQTVEAAKYSWKYEIGWSRIFFILGMIVLIILLGNFFQAYK